MSTIRLIAWSVVDFDAADAPTREALFTEVRSAFAASGLRLLRLELSHGKTLAWVMRDDMAVTLGDIRECCRWLLRSQEGDTHDDSIDLPVSRLVVQTHGSFSGGWLYTFTIRDADKGRSDFGWVLHTANGTSCSAAGTLRRVER